MANHKLQIGYVSDGKPGHQNQTTGLIQAVSTYRDVNVYEMPILSLPQVLRRFFLKQCGKDEGRQPDLIIGAGHSTHLSLLAYRRCLKGKTVVLMSPSLPTWLFDLCFIPRHDSPKNDQNVIETLGPINRMIPQEKASPDNGLIMLGGPSRHFNWDTAKVLVQIEKLISSNKTVHWTIASSRRTPRDCMEDVRRQFSGVEFVQPDDVSIEWLPEKMSESGQIWVTEDSMSMLYEALTTGAKTGVIELLTEKRTRITKEIERLRGEGLIVTVDTDRADNNHNKKAIFEADRCAQLLLKMFGL